MVRRLSHVRTAMFCLYKYPHDFMTEIPKKEDIHMTVSFVIFTIVGGLKLTTLGSDSNVAILNCFFHPQPV